MVDYQKEYKRMPFDPRMCQEIEGNATMRAEQGANFLGKWGGSTEYRKMSQMPAIERVVYKAVQDGITDEATLSSMTGLTKTEVSTAVSSLNKKGFINVQKAAEAEAL